MSGDGSFNHPWDLNSALSSTSLEDSDVNPRTLYLRGGVYSGSFTSTLDGRLTEPIIIRPYPNERVIIDGEFIFSGADITFRDVEFMCSSWWTRISSQEGSVVTDINATGVNIRTPRLKLINCIIHDTTGPYLGLESVNALMYGCISYYNGWDGTDRQHGHALYLQNQDLSSQMVVKDCILHDGFGHGFHAYSGTGSKVFNFLAEGNVSFRNGSLGTDVQRDFLLGADAGTANSSQFIANMSYGSSWSMFFYGAGASQITLTDNYFPNGITGTYYTVSESGNYYGPTTGNQNFVRPNEYQSDRANIIIYNEAHSDSVNVDLTSVTGLTTGLAYKLRNVQDYFSDIVTGIIPENKIISIDMRAASHTIAQPIPDSCSKPPTVFPDFGCFVIEKV